MEDYLHKWPRKLKTTLLDTLRKTSVVKSEAGGITQHIGAFSVDLQSGAKITFVDTPGHQLFTSMRARGVQVTDIAVLVVAINDGVSPTTIEAIKHAQAAHVPIIIALNKCDLPGINIERQRDMIFRQLMDHDIVVEEYGGDVQVAEISALKGHGLDRLEECITTLAEIMELKADPGARCEGVVLESKQVKGKGTVATILVQQGTLSTGSIMVFSNGKSWVRIRAMHNDKLKVIKSAGPSAPVEIIGAWTGQDHVIAGDSAQQVATEQEAKQLHDDYLQRQRRDKMAAEAVNASNNKLDSSSFEYKKQLYDRKVAQVQRLKMTNNRPQYYQSLREARALKEELELMQKDQQSISNNGVDINSGVSAQQKVHELNVVLKGDVYGSVDAVRYALDTMVANANKKARNADEQISIKILHSAVGPITQSDVDLLAATKNMKNSRLNSQSGGSFSSRSGSQLQQSQAIPALIAFNLPQPKQLSAYITQHQIPVISHKIIYNLLDDVKQLISGMLKPDYMYDVVGEARVQATFNIGKDKDVIAGCKVITGTLYRSLSSLDASLSDAGAVQSQAIKYRVLRNDIKVYEGSLKSLKHLKNDVKQVTNGMECGVLFEHRFEGPLVGDIIQCIKETCVPIKID
ncbi:hypothetical protein MIR68_002983 [Amoeboaphelidium protococcarum]|nr:hypothetical protein MIR68_002983 [Amoeboaphelidium protococcarum]